MFFLLFIEGSSFAVPLQMTQQGRVVDATGVPYEGITTFEYRIYDAETGGNILWEEVQAVSVTNGYYAAVLGADVLANPLNQSVLSLGQLYLELRVDWTNPLPRQPIYSAPYAQIASVAQTIDGGDVNAAQISVSGTPVVDSGGHWVGQPLTVDWGSVTSIPSGFSDGVDDVLNESQVEDFVSNSALDLASGTTVGGLSIVTPDTDQDSLALFSCTDEQILKYDAIVGDWFCESDNDSLSNLNCNHQQIAHYDSALGAWVCAEERGALGMLACSAGQVAYFDGSVWQCQNSTALFDQDGDNIPTWEDCDDTDSSSYSRAQDIDCDGFLADEDCDNADANSFTIFEDGDCDGAATADDCDDNDPSSTVVATDGDCDGFVFAADCDDNDPNSTIVALDTDCDGYLPGEDCDNADPTSYTTNEDGDCDGTITADDCDDNDENSTVVSEDADCDGDVDSSDCNDNDSSVYTGAAEICGDGIDQDCDGSDEPCFEEVTFINCGQTGRDGPSQSQCDSSYLGTELEGTVTVQGGMQIWTVPVSGTYTIEAFGAKGGDANTSFVGGDGARVQGDFNLTEGQVLTILVGQKGLNGSDAYQGGGGGGASYVVENTTALLVASGGGGATASYQCGSGSQCNGTGGYSSTATEGNGCNGDYGSCNGAGFSTNGDGTSFLNGGTGGHSNYTGHGGFGGGGGSEHHPGGGGGGYKGGGCGFNFPSSNQDTCNGTNNGQGGYSYNNGYNTEGNSSFNGGHGQVTISLAQ